jgi:aryl-alcohol dehydrogenase-like predicted oxidoreductase
MLALVVGLLSCCRVSALVGPVASTKSRFAVRLYSLLDSQDEVSRRQALQQLALATGAASLPAQASTATTTVPTVRLGSGSLEISKTIQGYWQLAGGHGRYSEQDAISNMKAHYKAGITTLDTADIYGPSELIIGKFVKDQPAAIPCTKFCCFRFLDQITREEVRLRVQSACERLQVSRLPLVQFFWSNYDIKRYTDVALYLTELKEEGLIQEIGATNFDLKRLKELKNAGVPLVSHQVQLSALDRRPVQSGMADWCAENNISLIGFGTVGSGILSDRYLGRASPTQEERNTASMRMYSSTAARFGDWKLVQDLLKTMDAISRQVRSDGRCGECNISNVAQRYVLQTPAVASVLIGVRNQSHIADNLRTHSFKLAQDEIDAIDNVVRNRSGPKGDVWDIERGYI